MNMLRLLAICLAAWALPASAGETLGVAAADGRMLDATLYLPAVTGPAPAVLVLGTHHVIESGKAEPADHDLGEALAEAGYVALVPAYGHPGIGPRPFDPRTMDDLQALARWLSARPEVRGRPLGVVGFAVGAYWAARLAAADPAVKAVVGYYGVYNIRRSYFAAMIRGGAVIPPAELAAGTAAAVLLLHGERDEEATLTQSREFKAALDRAGRPAELVVYPDAFHRFDRGPTEAMVTEVTGNDHRYRVDDKAAADAWTRALAWLDAHLR